MRVVRIHTKTSFYDVVVNDSSELSQKYMGEDIVKLQFSSSNPIRLSIGDNIEVFGRKFFLNTTPTSKKYSSKRYEYDCVFESYLYDLTKVAFLDIDETNVHFGTEFSVTGNLEIFCQLIKKNLERVYGKTCWDIQNTYDTLSGKNVAKTVTFSNDNCLSALGKIVDEFDIEYELSDDDPGVYQLTLYLRPIEGYSFPTPFEYGPGNGLYDITKKVASSNNITTRIYVYGSAQNIGSNYRNFSPRLKIPQQSGPDIVLNILSIEDNNWPELIVYGYTSGRFVQIQTLVEGVYVDTGTALDGSLFPTVGLRYNRPPIEYRVKAWNVTGSYLYSDGTSEGWESIRDSYVENAAAIQKYGLIERIVIFDDIFPEREGIVTGIGDNVFEFIDSGMFDLNEELGGNTLYIIPGLDPTIKFNTGNLAGYEFTISKYDSITKKFTINKIVDERGLVIPSPITDAFKIMLGDKYVILNINVPASYIEDAENRLLAAAYEWLDTYCNEQSSFELNIDEIFVELNNITFQIGSKISINDVALDITETRKVTELRRNLVRESKYTLTLSDSSFKTNASVSSNSVSINTAKSETSLPSSYEMVTCELIGEVNCVNTVFRTPMKYKSGSISVFVNGLKEKYFDEISENEIQLNSAPSNVGFIDIIHAIFTKKTI